MMNKEYQEYLKRERIKENIFSHALKHKENLRRGVWSNDHLIKHIVKPITREVKETENELSRDVNLISIEVMNVIHKAMRMTLVILLAVIVGIAGFEQIHYADLNTIPQIAETLSSITYKDVRYIIDLSTETQAGALDGFEALRDSVIERVLYSPDSR